MELEETIIGFFRALPYPGNARGIQRCQIKVGSPEKRERRKLRKSVTDVGLRVRMTCRSSNERHPAT